MKYLKLYENFEEQENLPGGDIPSDVNTGVDTSWTRSIDGKETTITLQDLNDYLDENNVVVEEIDTKSIEDILIETERDPNRVNSADLSFPIVVSKSNGEFKGILDGQHRVVKSIQNDIPTIKARVLVLDTAPVEYKKMFI
jgi:hypothetical protein